MLVWECRGEGEVTEAALPPQGPPQAPPHWQQEAPVSLLINCRIILPYSFTSGHAKLLMSRRLA